MVRVAEPDPKAVVDESSKEGKIGLWKCNNVTIFVDCDEEIGNGWGWRHAHRDPFVLMDNGIVEAHSIILHYDVDCFY